MKHLLMVLVAICLLASTATAQTVTADPLRIGDAGTFTSFDDRDVRLNVDDDFVVTVGGSSPSIIFNGGPLRMNNPSDPNGRTQFLARPEGGRNNIGQVESGNYGFINGTAKWLGLGSGPAGIGASVYGLRTQWLNHFGIFNLREVNSTTRDLVVQWGGTTSNNRLRFEYASSGTAPATTVAVFDSNGDFGIGNQNPGAPLHVGTTTGVGSRIRMGSIEFLEDGGANTIRSGGSIIPSSTSFDLGNTTTNWDDVYAQDFITVSDRRTKNSIADNEYGLAEIMKLHPVTFVYNNDKRGKRKVGLIAQEVNEVIAEVVSDPSQDRITGESGEALRAPEDSRMGINYSDLVPVLITAMQEQQAQITALQEELKALQTELGATPGEGSSEETQEVLPAGDLSPKLIQNYPNPVDGSTTIRYQVPQGSTASLVIYDLEGKQVQSFNISEAGEGSLELTSGTLAPGVYVYSLLVDGAKVDSKNMVVAER